MANMKRIRTGVMRTDPTYKKMIEEIQRKRLQMGKDPLLKPVKTSRITLALARHPLFKKIADDIIVADLK